MIDGVKIKELKVHKDIPDTDEPVEKEGFLMEVLRDDDMLMSRFGQTTFTVAYPKTIKAFHWHKKQDDLWFFTSGKAMVVLYDMREDSPTKGETMEILCSEEERKLVLIPIGVAHGYKVLGDQPAHLVYHVTQSYNIDNPDEERIAYNDAEIGYDWSKHN